eukprot:GHVP01021141.1.p1 GENE.GHVP01021141.1~~GHVP01021141.1.p1  ORF type:complete len:370 (+),score=71.91 GHVP01021141.1:2-1111(+)
MSKEEIKNEIFDVDFVEEKKEIDLKPKFLRENLDDLPPIVVQCLALEVSKLVLQKYKTEYGSYLLRKGKCKCVEKIKENNDRFFLILELNNENEKELRKIQKDEKSGLWSICERDIKIYYRDMDFNMALSAIIGDKDGSVVSVSSFEAVGHIAHLNLPQKTFGSIKHKIGQAIIDKNPSIKTVINKCGVVASEFRTMDFEVLAGKEDFHVTLQENSIKFEFDFREVYWSSRLAQERLNLSSSLPESSILLDVTAGAGGFGLYACRMRNCTSYMNDLNPATEKIMKNNVKINKLPEEKFHIFNLDGNDFLRQIVPTVAADIFQKKKRKKINSSFEALVVNAAINLPHHSFEFISRQEKWAFRHSFQIHYF